MIKEYSNVSRHNIVRQYLQNCKLEKIVENEECDRKKGLETMRRRITQFAPQGINP